jgi:hypothetical protein
MRKQRAEDIALIPFDHFRESAKRVFSNSKKESDRALEKFQASNARKRAAKKKKR